LKAADMRVSVQSAADTAWGAEMQNTLSPVADLVVSLHLTTGK